MLQNLHQVIVFEASLDPTDFEDSSEALKGTTEDLSFPGRFSGLGAKLFEHEKCQKYVHSKIGQWVTEHSFEPPVWAPYYDHNTLTYNVQLHAKFTDDDYQDYVKLIAEERRKAELDSAVEQDRQQRQDDMLLMSIAARDFFAWFNRHYPCPSLHPEHPYNILAAVIYGDADRAREAMTKKDS